MAVAKEFDVASRTYPQQQYLSATTVNGDTDNRRRRREAEVADFGPLGRYLYNR
jgi:hypothetical protein